MSRTIPNCRCRSTRSIPINEVVRVDYFLPGCPPSGEAIWKYLTDLILGRMPRLDPQTFHYD